MAFQLCSSLLVIIASTMLVQAIPALNYLRDNNGASPFQNQQLVYLRDNDTPTSVPSYGPTNFINNVGTSSQFQVAGPRYLPGYVQNGFASNVVNNVNTLGYPSYIQNPIIGVPTAYNQIPAVQTFGAPNVRYPGQQIVNQQTVPVEINYS